MSSPPLAITQTLTQDARTRLLEHFSGTGPPASSRWSSLWDAGDFLPWDRGTPNPALVDTLQNCGSLLGESVFINDPITGGKRRKRALVPGCGRGYDVLLLASFGYDAYGLEVSTKAVELCEEFARGNCNEYPVKNTEVGSGEIKFIAGDFFLDDWVSDTGGKTFELIYDYTFLCALHPSKRAEWSLRYSKLISPHVESGLICVEFPTEKEASTGGPPFGVPPAVYMAHLNNPGVEQPYDAEGNIIANSVEGESGTGMQRIAHWRPERTHEIGKGTDWVSVWRATHMSVLSKAREL